MQMQIFSICFQVLEQWGYLQKQAEKWIYPIPVLEAFIATKTCISNNHSAAGYVGYWTWDKDITTEYAYSWNNYPSYCFMIGKVQQQWGVGAASTNIMLPIPYTKVKFITLATSSMLNPSQGNISVAYHDSTLDSIRFQIRWQGLAAEYTGAWLTLGI